MAPIALFSLFDTTQALRFSKALIELGWEILATQETVDILEEEGIPCRDMASFTGVHTDYGFPPTLHPKMEYALTAKDAPERIELAYVISYPFDIGSDIGGRTLLGLAAKGNRIPVMLHTDFDRVIAELQHESKVSDGLRAELIQKTNAEIAGHYLKLV
ncbi:MAG: hypothetical protein MUO76_04955, partial [Anaerolineaceae bacterium]|nr:hypothetical protein [Anaerolineaceae bacterium]